MHARYDLAHTPSLPLSSSLLLSFLSLSPSSHFHFSLPLPSLILSPPFLFIPVFPFIHWPLFTILIHFSSASRPLHRQVAEQLAHYVRVSDPVITEDAFDAAVQFGTVQGGDPTRSRAGRPVCVPPPVAPLHPLGQEHQAITTLPTRTAASSVLGGGAGG